jgi:hypothetical protein
MLGVQDVEHRGDGAVYLACLRELRDRGRESSFDGAADLGAVAEQGAVQQDVIPVDEPFHFFGGQRIRE